MRFFNAWLWTLFAIQIQFGAERRTTKSMVSSHMHFCIHNLLYDRLSYRSLGHDRRTISAKGE